MMMMQPMQPPGMPPAGAMQPPGMPPAGAMPPGAEPAGACSWQWRTVLSGGVLCFAMVLVGALSALFSHILPWWGNGPTVPVWEDKAKHCLIHNGQYLHFEDYGTVKMMVKCMCYEDFPTYVWVLGILQIAGAFVYVLAAVGCAWRLSTEESNAATSCAVTISSWLAAVFALSSLAVAVGMSVSMFGSNKECGVALWNYGVFLLVFICVQSCALLVAALKTPCPT